MRIGVIASAGGSVFSEVFDRLMAIDPDKHEFCVITDRKCKIEDFCESRKIEHFRIKTMDNNLFSKNANIKFSEFGNLDFAILYFSRLITGEVFDKYPTFNIHPSLLPAFRGLNPIDNAINAKVKFFGATLHLVDNSIDNGPIIGQVCMPIRLNEKEEYLRKVSFIQKVYLSFLILELMEKNCIKNRNIDYECINNFPITDRCNPLLTNPGYLKNVFQIQINENIEVIK